ncbi:MAG: hypothetical protein CM1200mP10_16240 [Candidatus Neomarinimicrobiota bacterium]|nr:MAG: hypothetical protein CM1200mP10_16240 [Candidatus Neomarinimicrobiota bacterium]
METIYLDDFLDEGIIREKSFRQKVLEINWNDYNAKRVMIKGCTSVPVPTWAYLILPHNWPRSPMIFFTVNPVLQ